MLLLKTPKGAKLGMYQLYELNLMNAATNFHVEDLEMRLRKKYDEDMNVRA